jgi:hypothetical protein
MFVSGHVYMYVLAVYVYNKWSTLNSCSFKQRLDLIKPLKLLWAFFHASDIS